MSYTPVYTNRINWQNKPSPSTPLGQDNLNKMDYAIYKHDESLGVLDNLKADRSEVNSKANQSDLLQTIKTVSYNTSTGVFTFLFWNNSTITVDLNVEKIPVSFTMSASGVITMINTDGTTYTADIMDIIPVYTFNNSANIRLETVVDSHGDKTVTATIIDGSITANKLQPNYLADVTEQASACAADSVLARSYAVGGTGTRPGEDTDNAKYYKDQARAIVGANGHTIIDSHGTVYPNRMSLLFENGQIVDDATNDATHIILASTITDAEWSEINNILV